MATGFTAPVKDGKITEFREFALQCARAFGALIPQEFGASQYHAEAAEKARARLAELQAMTPVVAEAVAADENAETEARYAGYRAENDVAMERYRTMLAEVEAWTPPTSEHEGLKRFMREQLTESMRFDNVSWVTPPARDGATWLADETAKAQRDIAYHEKHQAEEDERTAGRNRWLRELRESLEAPVAG